MNNKTIFEFGFSIIWRIFSPRVCLGSSLASLAFARPNNTKNNACYAGYRSKRDCADILLPCNRTKNKMHAREILLSKHSLSENKYYFNLYEFLKRRIHALAGKLKNRCFFWFPAASATERDTNMASVSIQSFIKVGKTFFWISRISRRASSPTWASEASLARTRERAAKRRGPLARAFSRGSLRLPK